METLSDTIRMSMFFGNDISFRKDDITGAGVLLVIENKEHEITEQVLLPSDHIRDEKFVKYIKMLSNVIYEKTKDKE